MKSLNAVLVAAVAAIAVSYSVSAAQMIDTFDRPIGGTVVAQNGVGTNGPMHFSGLGANTIGGARDITVTVTASSGTAGASNKINGARPDALELNSDSDADALHKLAYGVAGDLNADFSAETGITVRVLASDLALSANSIVLRTTGGGSSSASFLIPAGVGTSLPTPFDVLVPFSSFVGGASVANVDQMDFNINGIRASDYTLDFVGTYVVPEPASMSLLGLVAAPLLRRRRA